MAVAEIIGAAVGVLILVVVAYLLVGGTLSTAETVVTAQKDITALQESRLRTHISVVSPSSIIDGNISFAVTNDGDEPVGDLSHMDVYSYNLTNKEYSYYSYDGDRTNTAGTWYEVSFNNAYVHANQLDPGATMHAVAILSPGEIPYKIQVTTSNGISSEGSFS